MPKTSIWTEVLSEELLEQFDAACEAIKELIGWPPLGMAELSPSGARARADRDSELLGEFFSLVGQEMALRILGTYGQAMVDRFGVGVIHRAVQEAQARMQGEPKGGATDGTA